MKRAMVWSIALTTLLASGQAQAQQINQRAARGLLLAKAVCAGCHAVEKYSLPRAIPPLRASKTSQIHRASRLGQYLRHCKQRPIVRCQILRGHETQSTTWLLIF